MSLDFLISDTSRMQLLAVASSEIAFNDFLEILHYF